MSENLKEWVKYFEAKALQFGNITCGILLKQGQNICIQIMEKAETKADQLDCDACKR
jgi:hypothetical protein